MLHVLHQQVDAIQQARQIVLELLELLLARRPRHNANEIIVACNGYILFLSQNPLPDAGRQQDTPLRIALLSAIT